MNHKRQRWLTAGVNVALIAISVNAVLIQTVATEESPLKNVIRVATLGLAVLLIAIGRARIPVVIFLASMTSLILMLGSSNPDQLSLLYVLILAPLLWSIPERSLDRAALLASIIGFGLIFLLLGAGVTQNTVQEFRNRATFGVDSVPFFMNVIYGVAALLIYYGFKYQLRTRWLVAAASVAVTYFFYVQTDGRGGFYAILTFVALCIAIPLVAWYPGVSVALAAIPVVFIGVFFWLAEQSQSAWWNGLLSYRPVIFSHYLDSLESTDIIFSASVKANTTVTNVDQSFIHLLVGTGILLFAFFCVTWAVAMVRLVADRRYLDIAFVISTAIYGLSESILLRIENVFIILTWLILLRAAWMPPRPAGAGSPQSARSYSTSAPRILTEAVDVSSASLPRRRSRVATRRDPGRT